MNIINEKVSHKKYGEGRVSEQSESAVTVDFGGEYGAKQFIYPFAFETFLELDDSKARENITDEIIKLREATAEKLRLRAEEAERQKEQERLALQEQKRSAARLASSKKKAKKLAEQTEQKLAEQAEQNAAGGSGT
ncbi:MAG: hypothetical protein LBM98_07080 [Oscillospiraceae bacterium]|jgi:hypothetical protein|nr:hypothetical protein [Oscillospiraceae bacterium]